MEQVREMSGQKAGLEDPRARGGKEEQEMFTNQSLSRLTLKITSKVDRVISSLQGRSLRHRGSTNFPKPQSLGLRLGL